MSLALVGVVHGLEIEEESEHLRLAQTQAMDNSWFNIHASTCGNCANFAQEFGGSVKHACWGCGCGDTGISICGCIHCPNDTQPDPATPEPEPTSSNSEDEPIDSTSEDDTGLENCQLGEFRCSGPEYQFPGRDVVESAG